MISWEKHFHDEMTEKNQAHFGWKFLVLQAHKNTQKCKNLVDSGLISGWKL